MNSILVGREIAKNRETERYKKLKKTIKVSAILAAQFVFGIPIAYGLVYGNIPLYDRQNETYRAVKLRPSQGARKQQQHTLFYPTGY